MIDVVVPSVRGPRRAARLVEALARQTVPFTLTLVDDGDSGLRFHRYATAVRHVALRRRSGPAAARNAGARAGTAPWLVFTDDDCLPPPGWLAALPRDADAVGGPCRAAGGVTADFLEAAGFMSGGDHTANFAVRRDWFERVGGFDERFRLAAGEDLDLARRLRLAGARVAFAPGWVNVHEAGGPAALAARYFRYGRVAGGQPKSLMLAAREGFSSQSRPAFRLLAALRQVSYEAGRSAA